MSKGNRANLDELLETAWKRQKWARKMSGVEKPQLPNKLKVGVCKLMWSWPVIGGIVFLILGGGLTFMTSGHPILADIFYLVGGGLFLSKFLTWEETKNLVQSKKRGISFGGTIVTVLVIVFALWGNHKLNAPGSVREPFSVFLENILPPNLDGSYGLYFTNGDHDLHPINSSLYVTITNNQDFPALIESVEVDALASDETWIPMHWIDYSKDILFGADLRKLTSFNNSPKLLEELKKPIAAHDTVTGWLFLVITVPHEQLKGTVYVRTILTDSTHKTFDSGAQTITSGTLTKSYFKVSVPPVDASSWSVTPWNAKQ